MESVIWLDLTNWQVSWVYKKLANVRHKPDIFLNVLGDGMESMPIWKENNDLKKFQQRMIGDIENVTP